MDPLLAEMDMARKVGMWVMYVFAVFGGFLVGNWVTWIICRLVAKAFLKQALPVRLEQAIRILGGIAVAVLVALLMFPGGGTGWGLGGSGQGEGTGAPTKGGEQPDTSKDKPTKKDDPKPKENPAELSSGITVTILRGQDHPRSYRFEGETEGVDLATAKARLRELHEQRGGRLKFVDLLIYRNSTAGDHPLVRDYEEYAHGLGLRTSRKRIDQPLPE